MFEGKHIFSWNVPQIQGGDPKKFTQYLLDNQFEGVYLKVADGPYVFTMSKAGPWPKWGENVRDELVAALKAAGLKVYLWVFNYGNDVPGELKVAKNQVARFEPDGLIWDVEGKFDSQPGAIGAAHTLATGLRKSFPNLAQALCWWALPYSDGGAPWHPIAVAQEFMKTVDVGMPMMYWQGSGALAAERYFNRSITGWKRFWSKPLIPVGRSFTGGGGYGDPLGITAFASLVMANRHVWTGMPGISWWSIDHASKEPSWMTALRETPTYGVINQPPVSRDEMLDRLVAAHPELFPELQ